LGRLLQFGQSKSGALSERETPAAEARKGPLATVVILANRFGMDGWELREIVSQPHSIYRLSFTLSYLMEDEVS
jgi:hypothetical protein